MLDSVSQLWLCSFAQLPQFGGRRGLSQGPGFVRSPVLATSQANFVWILQIQAGLGGRRLGELQWALPFQQVLIHWSVVCVCVCVFVFVCDLICLYTSVVCWQLFVSKYHSDSSTCTVRVQRHEYDKLQLTITVLACSRILTHALNYTLHNKWKETR